MKLRARVIRPREASATEADGRKAEIASVLLDHDVGRELRCAKQAVQARVHATVLTDAVVVFRPGVVVARFELDERKLVRRVAVHFVGAHVNERRLGAVLPRRFQHIERAGGVDVEIVKRPIGRKVVRGLRRAVDDQMRPDVTNEAAHALAIANVEIVMGERRC